MIEMMQLNVWGWLIMGFTTGLGPCLSHQGMIIMPYLTVAGRGPWESIKELLGFASGRIITYTTLGLIAGSLGIGLREYLLDQNTAQIIQAFMGLLLISLAILFVLGTQNPLCRYLHNIPGKPMAIIGVFTALSPCPTLLGLITYAAARSHPLEGSLAGLFFALGSSLTPLLLLGPAWAFLQNHLGSKLVLSLLRGIGGLILFAYGWHLFLHVFL